MPESYGTSKDIASIGGTDTLPGRVRAIHLDAVGGIAGDMFAAACLDAMPSLWPACETAIARLAPPQGVTAKTAKHSDGILCGSRFVVEEPGPAAGVSDGHAQPHHERQQHGHHRHGAAHAGGHAHTHWHHIRELLHNSDLPSATAKIATAIFTRLAAAEAKIHGVAIEDVSFHEVGAWDSIIDIVTAATIIAELDPCAWSVGALPRGRGLVRTAHGMLPVPAPATVELLTGFTLYDDGEDGERITPTGAAILNYLDPSQAAHPTPRRLLGSGIGFGTRSLKSRSNILRAALYGDPRPVTTPMVTPVTTQDTVVVLRCEIDDQSAEDLAIALDHIRSSPGVLDVCQWPVFAKKGRIATALQVLAAHDAGDRIAALLFHETTTLGVRHSTVARATLRRELATDDDGVRVKQAFRSAGTTAKAERDDLASFDGHAERMRRARLAEQRALQNSRTDDD